MNIRENYTYFYFVTAVDVLANQESAQSNITDTYVPLGGLGKQIPELTGEVFPILFFLYQNYPNPFNPSTQIFYSIAQDAEVTIKVYDLLGTEVAELINETQAAGSYEINFNALNLSSGVYIYCIRVTNNGRILFTDSKQMILLR